MSKIAVKKKIKVYKTKQKMKKTKNQSKNAKVNVKKLQSTLKNFTKNNIIYKLSQNLPTVIDKKPAVLREQKCTLQSLVGWKSGTAVQMPIFLDQYPLPHENFTYTCCRCMDANVATPAHVDFQLNCYVVICQKCI